MDETSVWEKLTKPYIIPSIGTPVRLVPKDPVVINPTPFSKKMLC